MKAESSNRSTDLLRDNKDTINHELAFIDRVRIARAEPHLKMTYEIKGQPANMDYIFEYLKTVRNPRFVLASSTGEFIVGDIDSTHASLFDEWNAQRKAVGKPQIARVVGSVVSAIAFDLNGDPDTHYVRLSVDSNFWDHLPAYAQALIDGGYTVVDASFKRVAPDIDYSVDRHMRENI